MALPAGAKTGQGVSIRTSDPTGNAQRWRLEAVGTDSLSGESTAYYRVVEMTQNLALAVYGTEAKEGAYVTATSIQSGDSGKMQYWYLQGAPGSDTYYLAPRSNASRRISESRPTHPAW